jgi:proteasome accessory factor C
MPVEPTGSRLERILVLVPWVVAHPGVTVDEVGERFGVTRAELLADLELLFVCGLPPFGPGDLIEAYVDGDIVTIRFADYLSRPMRLTRREALVLLAVGRALASQPGLAEAASLRSALGKLERATTPDAASAAKDAAEHVAIDVERQPGALHALRLAISQRRRVRMTYYSFGRGEMTERVVCPLVVFTTGGSWYMEAFDEKSGEDRIFRVDRIRDLVPAGEACEEHETSRDRPTPERLFTAGEHDLEAAIDVSPKAGWVAERTPHESAKKIAKGWTRLTLRTPNLPWLERLLLQLGDEGRASAPPELAEGVREIARKALARYEGGARSSPPRTRRAARGGS